MFVGRRMEIRVRVWRERGGSRSGIMRIITRVIVIGTLRSVRRRKRWSRGRCSRPWIEDVRIKSGIRVRDLEGGLMKLIWVIRIGTITYTLVHICKFEFNLVVCKDLIDS